MTRCVILGGNGFIGSHLAEGLVKARYDVTIFDNFKRGTKNLDAIIDKIEIIKGDFWNEDDICDALKDIDFLFHYISTTTPATATKNPIYDIESNIIGSVKLFQNAVMNNVKKIIFSSSGGTIYGDTTGVPMKETDPLNPINPYAISKLTIEKYLHYFNQIHGMDYTILRYSNPYGERQNPSGKQGVIPIFLNKIKHHEQPVIYGDGSMVRDYIYIKDAIDATLAIFEKKTNEKVFNVGSGDGTSLNDLIEIMSDISNEKIVPTYMENHGVYIHKIMLDISKIKKETGWNPKINMQEGIERTKLWIDNNF